jgi:hypothetical protein
MVKAFLQICATVSPDWLGKAYLVGVRRAITA